MNTALYDQAIKELARAAHGAGALAAAAARARLDNPYCGDRIDLALTLVGARLGAVAHETWGCLLCRAAASAIGLRAPGARVVEVEQAEAALDALLAGDDAVALPWPELAVFRPVRDYPARHGCVTLPMRALAKAIAMARSGDGKP